MLTADAAEALTLILSVLLAAASGWLAWWFSREASSAFRALTFFFVVLTAGFVWLALVDFWHLAYDVRLWSPVRALVFRGVFLVGIGRLVWALRNGE